MKKIVFWGVAAALLSFGLVFASCDDGSKNDGGTFSLKGTWASSTDRFIFDGTDFVQQMWISYITIPDWEDSVKGSFSLNADKTKLTLNGTHSWQESAWKSLGEDAFSLVYDIKILSNMSIQLKYEDDDDWSTYTKK